MKNEEVKKKSAKKGKATTKGSTAKKSGSVKKEANNVSKKKSTTKVRERKVEATTQEVIVNVNEDELVKENASKDDILVNEDKSNNKKGDIFLILGLVIVLVLGFIVMRDKNAGPSYELPLTLMGDAGLHQLTYEEYQEKIDNNDSFVVILERATCSYCVTYMPVAEEFATSNNVPMYYVDTDTFTADDWENFERSNSYLKKANGDWGTPTTLVLAGNQTVDYIEGATTAEDLLALYNDNFDMKEE